MDAFERFLKQGGPQTMGRLLTTSRDLAGRIFVRCTGQVAAVSRLAHRSAHRCHVLVTLLASLGGIVTFLLGIALTGCQGYIYLQEGRWYSASLLQVATYDVEPRLAGAIQAPILGSWHEVHAAFAEAYGDRSTTLESEIERAHAELALPPLGKRRLWLKYPDSWLGLHKAVAGLLDILGLGFVLCVSAFCLTFLSFSPVRHGEVHGEEPPSYD